MTQPIDNKNEEGRVTSDVSSRDFVKRQRDSLNTREAVAERLKQARQSMALTQKEAALKANGMPLPSYKDYETGKKMPGGEAIQGLTKLGINSNWLLTGKGSMLLADMRASTIAEFEDDYEELGRAFAEALGLSKDDLLQARADVTKAMEGIRPDDNNLEGTYPKYLAHLREAYLNVAKSLISKNPLVWATQPVQQDKYHMERLLFALPSVSESLEQLTPDPARLRMAFALTEDMATVQPLTPEKRADIALSVYQRLSKNTAQ